MMKSESSVVWILVRIVLVGCLLIGPCLFGTTEAPIPKPMIDINQALKLGIDTVMHQRNTSNLYLTRAWLKNSGDGKNEHWILLWCPVAKDRQATEDRLMVEVQKNRSVSFQSDIPNWLGVESHGLGTIPEIDMIRAIELASKHAGKKKDLAGYYIDRVWLGQVEDSDQRKWFVTWSPDVGGDGTAFWFKVTVDMKGHAEDFSGDCKWLPPQPLLTPPVITPK